MLAILLLLMADKAEIVQGVAGSRTDGLELKAGGLVVREGEAGAAFGTMQVGKGKRQVGYFLVLKHSFPGTGKSESNEDVMAEDAKATANHSVTLDGKTLAFVHAVTLDAAKKVKSETFAIGGKAVDAAKGRVFLVDLTAEPPRWEQKKLDLPAETADLGTNKAATDAARAILASLAKQDRKARAFIDSAAPKR